MADKIVIGVDSTEPARAALRWGIEYAARVHAPVELFYVVDLTPFSDSPAFESEAREAGQALLDEELAEAKQLNPQVEVSTRLLLGAPSTVFEEESKGAQLVVVGTHKGAKVPNILFGSKPIRIAATAHAPVAVVPAVDFEGRHGVFVAVDGSETADIALEYAAQSALDLGETLTILTVWAIPALPASDVAWSAQVIDEVREQSNQVIADARALVAARFPDVNVETAIVEADPVRGIVETAGNARLLVVGNRGRRGLSRLVLGSVSHGVLANITAPTIVVRKQQVAEQAEQA